jgi:hypothetical protein
MKPRINIYEQISAFYSFVFENQNKVNQSHVSLYMFLINQNNRNNWSEWFKLPYDLAMAGACIGSKSTYYKCLNDLSDWKLITYIKGKNEIKAPLISIFVLSKSEPLTVPLSEPLTVQPTVPLGEQLSVLLTGNIDILITNNFQLITNNIHKWIKSELNESIDKKESDEMKEHKLVLFTSWWSLYNKKVGKEKAQNKWVKLSLEEINQCLNVVNAYVKSTPDIQFRKDPTTYINGKHWNDEIIFKTNNNGQSNFSNQPKQIESFAESSQRQTAERIAKLMGQG